MSSVSTREEGDFQVITTTYDDTDNITDVTKLGLNDDIVWPGSMVRGESANNFNYVPLFPPRAPLRLSLDVVGAQFGPIGITVNSPNLDGVRQGVNDLLRQAIGQGQAVAAQADFELQEVHSESQMSAFLGVDISRGGLDSSVRIDFVRDRALSKFVVKYRQIYFSVDATIPNTQAGWFPADVQLAALATSLPPNSQPLFVAGVDYGMMAVMTVTSDQSSEEVRTALSLAYETGLTSGTVTSGRTVAQVLSNASIRAVGLRKRW